MNIFNPNQAKYYIYQQESHWYQIIKPFLFGKIIKVGHGLGYLSSFISNDFPTTILDIGSNRSEIGSQNVIIYDGYHFPFTDKSFDVSICYLVLHHTPNPFQIIREMLRVSNRLIIFEETYTSFYSKLDLIYRDILINVMAHQSINIHWNSYFSTKSLHNYLNQHFKIVSHYSEQKRSYFKELYITESPSPKK